MNLRDFELHWGSTIYRHVGLCSHLLNINAIGGNYSVTLNPERSVIFDNTAVAHGVADHKITKGNGKTFEFPGQWTVVLRKHPEGWKIVRVHSSVSSMNNSLLHDYVKSQLFKTAFIAGGVSLVLGALITYVILRNRFGV